MLTNQGGDEGGWDAIDGHGDEGTEYTIATHFVKVRRSGALSDVTTIWDLVGTEAISGSLDSILTSKPGFDRLPSINAFDKVCVCVMCVVCMPVS